MSYYPRTLREQLRHKLSIELFGIEATESPLMRELFEHERRMRTDPVILQRRAAEQRESNRRLRWVFAAATMLLAAGLLQLAAILPLIADVSRGRTLAAGILVFVVLIAWMKRALLPATPPWALWSHYLAYDRPAAEAPAVVSPWLWLVTIRTSRWRGGYCRVVDAATGLVIYEWARPQAERPAA